LAGHVTDARARLGGHVVDVAVDGGFVRTESVGDGPALLLLHGWTLDRRMWLPQLPLGARHRLVTLDRRGFGQSSAPPDLAREPADLLTVADALGLGRIHLLGMSQAGRVAIRFALNHPDRVAGLHLFGTALDGRPEGVDDEAVPTCAMRDAFAAGRPDAARALWRAHPLARLHTPGAAPLLEAMLAEYDGRDLVAAGRPLPVSAADVAALSPPVHCIVGAEDTAWRRAVARAIAAQAPRGTLSVVADGGHLANLDRPDAFNARLLAGIDALQAA
jgi:3-oxoadipate enol-lactonase